MEYNDFEEENECQGCVDFDYEGSCYFYYEACKICMRNPFCCSNGERNMAFINKAFFIQPPEDMYLAEINPDSKSIGFIARFGLPQKKTERLNSN